MNLITRSKTSVFLAVFSLATLLSGCEDKAIEKITYTANVPIYAKASSLSEGIGSQEAKELSGAGKIHIKGRYLYIVNPFEGIHVIDNGNPSSPQNVSYINLPGVLDIASHGSTMYADSYEDLVALDISNPFSVRLIDRDQDVFHAVLPPTLNSYPISSIDETQGVVVGWKVEEVTEKREVDSWGGRWNRGEDFFLSDVDAGSAQGGGIETASVPNQAPGKSGSEARFTAVGDYLYVVNHTEIKVVDLGDEQNPALGSTVRVDRDVETIFPMDGKLFLGTTTGMVIYDLTNPASPSFLSAFNHSTSCDPVVVEGDYAYVTLRSGSECGGWSNQLDVLDISDITQPILVATYPFTNPHGLGIDNNILFLCDGEDGLKVFDATDKENITSHQLAHYQGIQAYDVIPLGETLLMTGEDGLFQYDYSDPKQISELSYIKTK